MTTPFFDLLEEDGHQAVILCHDRASGLKAFVAIHDTTLGPAAGGTRRWSYPSEREALQDALRLSRGMTLKLAASGMNYGGGKIVMLSEPGQPPLPARYRALGSFIDGLQGTFVTGEDVGTGHAELACIAERTRYAVGLPRPDLDKPPTSSQTALGVLRGIQACLEHLNGEAGFPSRTVAIQGLGHVGMNLAGMLHAAGSRLIVADLDREKVGEAVERFGARAVPVQRIFEVECDVFAPCALGGCLNSRTIPLLRAPIVAGSANNQLADAEDAARLHRRGIVYAPDFVINAGGAIDNVSTLDPRGYDRERVRRLILAIYDRVKEILRVSASLGTTTESAALGLAQKRLEAARSQS